MGLDLLRASNDKQSFIFFNYIKKGLNVYKMLS